MDTKTRQVSRAESSQNLTRFVEDPHVALKEDYGPAVLGSLFNNPVPFHFIQQISLTGQFCSSCQSNTRRAVEYYSLKARAR